jgi:hypothetical protein
MNLLARTRAVVLSVLMLVLPALPALAQTAAKPATEAATGQTSSGLREMEPWTTIDSREN